MIKADMAESLMRLGRHDEVPAALVELRSALDDTVVELRSITMLRPFGPSVTFTASARTFTPLTIWLRALS